MRRSVVLWLACLIGVTGCADDTSTSTPRPPESRLTVETQYTCMSIPGPGGMTPVNRATTAPWLAPGNRTLHGNSEWKALWNSARHQPDTEPPMPLPDDKVAVVITNQASMQVHTHIRWITETAEALTIQLQTEVRVFPEKCHDGRCARSAVYDSDHIETLVVFLPATRKEIRFESLPNLVWTPATDEDVTSEPSCPYRY